PRAVVGARGREVALAPGPPRGAARPGGDRAMTIPVRRLAAALLVLSVVAAPGHGVRAADSAGGQGATPAQATEARPWLGVSLVGGPDAASTGVPIRAVAEGGPAAAAGI